MTSCSELWGGREGLSGEGGPVGGAVEGVGAVGGEVPLRSRGGAGSAGEKEVR